MVGRGEGQEGEEWEGMRRRGKGRETEGEGREVTMLEEWESEGEEKELKGEVRGGKEPQGER